MIKIDLITGFLGSGKTSFIKRYAGQLMSQGLNIGQDVFVVIGEGLDKKAIEKMWEF